MNKLQIPDFSLCNGLSKEQKAFFDKYGVIIFRNFISPENVQLFLSEIHRIEKEWLDQGVEKINGVPLKFGRDEQDNKTIQRLCFTSNYSSILHEFLQDLRLQCILELISPIE